MAREIKTIRYARTTTEDWWFDRILTVIGSPVGIRLVRHTKDGELHIVPSSGRDRRRFTFEFYRK